MPYFSVTRSPHVWCLPTHLIDPSPSRIEAILRIITLAFFNMLHYILKHAKYFAQTSEISPSPKGLAFSTDGRHVATCCGDTIRVFQCASGDELCNMPVLGAEATTVIWATPDLFISGWSNGVLMVARINRAHPKNVTFPVSVKQRRN